MLMRIVEKVTWLLHSLSVSYILSRHDVREISAYRVDDGGLLPIFSTGADDLRQ